MGVSQAWFPAVGRLSRCRSRGVAWPNTRPCQGRERRFESGRDRHLTPPNVERWPSPVEGDGLENRYRCKPIESSNLSLSAIQFRRGHTTLGGPPNTDWQMPAPVPRTQAVAIERRPSGASTEPFVRTLTLVKPASRNDRISASSESYSTCPSLGKFVWAAFGMLFLS